MKVHTKVVVDMGTGEVLEDEFYEYEGPVARADFGTISGPLLASIITSVIASQAAKSKGGGAGAAPAGGPGAAQATPFTPSAGQFQLPPMPQSDALKRLNGLGGIGFGGV